MLPCPLVPLSLLCDPSNAHESSPSLGSMIPGRIGGPGWDVSNRVGSPWSSAAPVVDPCNPCEGVQMS